MGWPEPVRHRTDSPLPLPQTMAAAAAVVQSAATQPVSVSTPEWVGAAEERAYFSVLPVPERLISHPPRYRLR